MTNVLAMTVSPEGLITLTLDELPVMSGIPNVYDVTPSVIRAEQSDPHHASIAMIDPTTMVALRWNVELIENDLLITLHLLNGGAAALSNVAFNVPAFAFSRIPTGTMTAWHWTYLVAQGASTLYPSYQVPVGCVTAGDDTYGISAYSPSEHGRSKQHLIQSAFNNNELGNPLTLEFHSTQTVQPAEALTIDVRVRVTKDQTPQGFLSEYKKHMTPLQYKAQLQPMIQFVSVDQAWVTAEDPYGYNGDGRRIDTEEGANAYLANEIPRLKALGASGILFWAPGGVWPIMYPVDYDINLQRISATWPIVVSGLKAAGFRVGIAARMGEYVPASAGPLVRADPRNPVHVEALKARLDYCVSTGIDMWYIDSAGGDIDSVWMIQIARAHLGSNHLFFTEFTSDSMIPYGGQYVEWMGGGTRWFGETTRSHFTYLFNGFVSNVCVDRSGTLTNQAMINLGLMPLVLD